jgi:hypothetical protein
MPLCIKRKNMKLLRPRNTLRHVHGAAFTRRRQYPHVCGRGERCAKGATPYVVAALCDSRQQMIYTQ